MALSRRAVNRTALVVALMAAIWGIYLLIGQLADLGPEAGANRLLLPFLSAAIVVLTLALAGVLVRNLVRLIMDRKRGILGSKLRTKLVFFFLALVLPPALLLFYGSAAVIRMTVDAMLRPPVSDLTEHARDMLDSLTDFQMNQCLEAAQELSDRVREGAYLAPGRARELESLLDGWRESHGVDLVTVISPARTLARSADPELPDSGVEAQELDLVSAPIVEKVLAGGPPAARLDHLGEGLIAHAVAPIRPANGSSSSGPVGVVAVMTFLPRELASRMEQIAAVADSYRQLRVQRRDLVRLYLSLILLIFLVTVFGATWMGFYLSRRITVPIEELARATREISAGNLGVRVRADVGDEVGKLVDSFNEMAEQLQDNRRVIRRSTADLQRSNRALDERRRYIETLVQSISTGIISLDPAGRVTTANPAVERILGVRIRVGGDVRSDLAHPGLEPLLELVDRALASEGQGLRHDLGLSRGGGVIMVAVQITPLVGEHGESPGRLVMLEDLTDLVRAQRAEAWSEVARRIAHEIKNPLTPIQLAAQRLRKRFDEGASDVGQVLHESTATIESEVGALKRLVDEFSRFARLPELSVEAVEFRQVIDSVLALYRGHPHIHWEVDTAEEVGTVKVDAEQMRRALINLIDNAVAAMSGTGTIRIESRAHAGPGSLHIEVSDTGPGIPTGDRDKMFVPYFSTKRRGTGLGLAIVHRVITDHRGTIRVEDNEPRGARFVIEIPA